ncbi:MAG: hypothetical protein HQK56_16615 [Deltaproteobacteria bacterium]|nr:hypothetical protein [Deltaproteobacteria bacterium]
MRVRPPIKIAGIKPGRVPPGLELNVLRLSPHAGIHPLAPYIILTHHFASTIFGAIVMAGLTIGLDIDFF